MTEPKSEPERLLPPSTASCPSVLAGMQKGLFVPPFLRRSTPFPTVSAQGQGWVLIVLGSSPALIQAEHSLCPRGSGKDWATCPEMCGLKGGDQPCLKHFVEMPALTYRLRHEDGAWVDVSWKGG